MDIDPNRVRLDPMRVLSKHEVKMAIRKGLTQEELEHYMRKASLEAIHFCTEVFSVAVAVALFERTKLSHDEAAEAIGAVNEVFTTCLDDEVTFKDYKEMLERDHDVVFVDNSI